jgi:hypothetical protein
VPSVVELWKASYLETGDGEPCTPCLQNDSRTMVAAYARLVGSWHIYGIMGANSKAFVFLCSTSLIILLETLSKNALVLPFCF